MPEYIRIPVDDPRHTEWCSICMKPHCEMCTVSSGQPHQELWTILLPSIEESKS